MSCIVYLSIWFCIPSQCIWFLVPSLPFPSLPLLQSLSSLVQLTLYPGFSLLSCYAALAIIFIHIFFNLHPFLYRLVNYWRGVKNGEQIREKDNPFCQPSHQAFDAHLFWEHQRNWPENYSFCYKGCFSIQFFCPPFLFWFGLRFVCLYFFHDILLFGRLRSRECLNLCMALRWKRLGPWTWKGRRSTGEEYC